MEVRTLLRKVVLGAWRSLANSVKYINKGVSHVCIRVNKIEKPKVIYY